MGRRGATGPLPFLFLFLIPWYILMCKANLAVDGEKSKTSLQVLLHNPIVKLYETWHIVLLNAKKNLDINLG